MAKGLKMPVGVDATGSAAMVDGENDNLKTLFTAFSDCENAHPFQQDIGLGNFAVFSISDKQIRAKIQRKVEAIFQQFEAENRFRLVPGSIEWIESTDTGDLSMSLKYVDLELEETKSFQRVFTSQRIEG